MGTRGYYIYKWRGRYYVYYNHWDSYPAGLGMQLVQMIPSEPDQYRQWLKQKRADYTEAETLLERAVFTVDPARATKGTDVPFSTFGAENAEKVPNYNVLSRCSSLIEWIYIIDLDREIFWVSGDSYFCLSRITKQWDTVLSAAERLHLSACRQARLAWVTDPHGAIFDADTGITSNILPYLEPREDFSLAYSGLSVSLVMPSKCSKLAKRPVATVARCVYTKILEKFSPLLWQAQYTSSASDFIFREAAFVLLCIRSSSPELLRMETRTNQTEETLSAPFAMLRASNCSGNGSEFASAAFQGYHLKDKTPGSSPSGPFYWLLGVLVSLNRDLASPKSIQKAVVDTVAQGRRTGRECFNAVIISISHVILVRVTKDSVQHTKRLQFVDTAQFRDGYAVERRRRIETSSEGAAEDESDEDFSGSEHDETQDTLLVSPSMTAWVETEQVDTLGALAGLFEATARDLLKPTTISQGIFPNEIYHQIMTFVDPPTRIACLTVSRVFRDYASEIFCMSDDLSLRLLPGASEPQCYHPVAKHLGPFRLSEQSEFPLNGNFPQWCPVIGHCNGTASFVPQHLKIGPLLGYDPSPIAVENLPGHDLTKIEPRYLRSKDVDEAYSEVFLSFHAQRICRSNSESADRIGLPLGYSLFEKYLPSQELFASSSDIMGLYAITFFYALQIFGCKFGLSNHWRRKALNQIGIIPINTCIHLASRWDLEVGVQLTYGLAWAKPPSEDSSSGWEQAIRDATQYATRHFTRYQQLAWLNGRDVNNDDFAILIMIGRRCRFFHQRSLPVQEHIPNVHAFPKIKERFQDRYSRQHSGYESWEEAGISVEQMSSRNSLRWEPIHEILKGDGIVPLDLLNLSHRPQIEKALKWIQHLASSRGKEENTDL